MKKKPEDVLGNLGEGLIVLDRWKKLKAMVEEKRDKAYSGNPISLIGRTLSDVLVMMGEVEEEVNLENKRKGIITLWIEGFCATETRGEARFLGEFQADNLRDAVIQYKNTLEAPDRYHVNTEECNLTLWGCKFFDNEADARKSFG